MTKLNRSLSLTEVTLSGVGIILGAGIYALVGKAAAISGNGLWLSFFFAALVAAFTGLSYAELSSIFPKAGADYTYAKGAFGQKMGFLVGWLVVTGGLVAAATVALGFAGYFEALTTIPIIIGAILLIVALSILIFRGIKQSVTVAIVFTVIEALGLFAIIFIGLPNLGSVNYFEFLYDPAIGLQGVFAAAALIFFAFIGFEDMVTLSEETKKPEKNMPRAIILALIISTVIYVLVGAAAISTVDWQVLAASNAPLAEVAASAFGAEAFFAISLIALFATANTVLLLLITVSRVTYGMADSGSLPKKLATVHPKTKAPYIAVALIGFLALIFVTLGDIELVAKLSNLTVFVAFMVINTALIVLRYKRPDAPRVFKTPLNIGKFPVLAFLGVITCAFFLLQLGLDILVYGAVLIIAGLILNEVLIRW